MGTFYCNFLHKTFKKCSAEKQKSFQTESFQTNTYVTVPVLEQPYFGVSSPTVVPRLQVKKSVLKSQARPSHVVAPCI